MRRASISLALICCSVVALGVAAAPSWADPGECDDFTFYINTRYESNTIPWRISASVPDNFRRTSMYEGHHAWTIMRNNCGFANQNRMSFNYNGIVNENVHTYYDNINTVDINTMPSIGCSSSAAACTILFYNSSSRIKGADTRFNLYSGGLFGQADMTGLMAHESGHALGLFDLYSGHDRLTMYGIVPSGGSTIQDTLGRGDRDGLYFLY